MEALKECWPAAQQPGNRMASRLLAGQWEHHNLPIFLHPCNRSQAPTLRHSSPLGWGGLARRWSTRATVVQLVVLGVFLKARDPQSLPQTCGTPLLRALPCRSAGTRAPRTDRSASCRGTSVGLGLDELAGKSRITSGALAPWLAMEATQRNGGSHSPPAKTTP